MFIVKALACYLCCFSSYTIARNGVLIAVVDMEKVESSAKTVRNIQKKIQRMIIDYKETWQSKKTSVDNAIEDIKSQIDNIKKKQKLIGKVKLTEQKKQESAKLSDELSALEKKLESSYKDLEKLAQEKQEKQLQLNNMHEKAINTFQKKLVDKSQEIAKSRGSNVIVMPSQVFFAKTEGDYIEDITDAIVTAMNEDEDKSKS